MENTEISLRLSYKVGKAFNRTAAAFIQATPFMMAGIAFHTFSISTALSFYIQAVGFFCARLSFNLTHWKPSLQLSNRVKDLVQKVYPVIIALLAQLLISYACPLLGLTISLISGFAIGFIADFVYNVDNPLDNHKVENTYNITS